MAFGAWLRSFCCFLPSTKTATVSARVYVNGRPVSPYPRSKHHGRGLHGHEHISIIPATGKISRRGCSVGSVFATFQPGGSQSVPVTAIAPVAPTAGTAAPMDPMLAEVLAAIGSAFYHVPYAVSGRAAMHAHGFVGRTPTHVSILCPEHSKNVIKSWAAVAGMVLSSDSPDQVKIKTSDGRMWRVRFKYVSSRFDELETVGLGITRVLGLASLVDQVAKAWVYTKNPETEFPSLKRDMFWLLEKIVEKRKRNGGMLTAGQVPGVLNPLFWDVFTCVHPEAATMFAQAGLEQRPDTSQSDGLRGGDWIANHSKRHDVASSALEATKVQDWVPDWLAACHSRGSLAGLTEPTSDSGGMAVSSQKVRA
jgi:hypothetical protein